MSGMYRFHLYMLTLLHFYTHTISHLQFCIYVFTLTFYTYTLLQYYRGVKEHFWLGRGSGVPSICCCSALVGRKAPRVFLSFFWLWHGFVRREPITQGTGPSRGFVPQAVTRSDIVEIGLHRSLPTRGWGLEASNIWGAWLLNVLARRGPPGLPWTSRGAFLSSGRAERLARP